MNKSRKEKIVNEILGYFDEEKSKIQSLPLQMKLLVDDAFVTSELREKGYELRARTVEYYRKALNIPGKRDRLIRYKKERAAQHE